MPRLTLLEIVQDILNDMESDEVNSINDTVEAQQVVSIIHNTYNEIIDSRLWPTTYSIRQLTSLSALIRPTHLLMDDTIDIIDWIKYDKKKVATDKAQYELVSYKEPNEFLNLVLARDSTSSSISTILDINNTPLFIKNDCAPTYWTSFDDKYIIFDSYDSGIDTTIQSSKTMASVSLEPPFLKTDTFIPDLPSKAFSYLTAESKSSCFEKLKQAPSAKEEQKSRRQRIFLSQEKWRKNRGIKYQGFGRK
jgi:hypothetical protein